MSNTDLEPVIEQSLEKAIVRNVRSNWSDIPPRTKVFALEFVKHGDVKQAQSKAKIKPAMANKLLANPLVKAYLDYILVENAGDAVITRDFLQIQMLDTLEQVNGDVSVPLMDKGVPVEAKSFNASAKISLLKEMRMFLDVTTPEGQNRVQFLSNINPSREREFADPDELWRSCIEYFQWVEDNPVFSVDVQHVAGKAQETKTPHQRIPTETSLCIFIGVLKTTWDTWGGTADSEFCPVVEVARQFIDEQQLAGGAAGTFNSNIIARNLGLTDNRKHEHTGRGGGPIVTISGDMDPKEAAEAYQDTLAEL